MSLSQEDVSECLNLIDQIIGKNFKELNFGLDKEHGWVRITARCRNCKRKVLSARDTAEPNWAANLVDVIVTEAEQHHRDKHTSLILLPSQVNTH